MTINMYATRHNKCRLMYECDCAVLKSIREFLGYKREQSNQTAQNTVLI